MQPGVCTYMHFAIVRPSFFFLFFFPPVSINELKNREVIDVLDKRSEYKGIMGVHWKKTVSPLNVYAADRQIHLCDSIPKKRALGILVSNKVFMWTVFYILFKLT